MTSISKTMAVGMLVLCGARAASAQEQPAGESAPQPEPVGGTTLSTTDHSDERPEPPGKIHSEDLQRAEGGEMAVAAGMGSDLAYAHATVVELGGLLAFTHASETTIFRIAPSIGYFLADNIEFTLFPELTVVNVAETDVIFGAMLEPSYHLPFSDVVFGFLGLGVGIRYAEEPGVDFALRPRLGLDIMIGRSGILKPAGFIDIGANDGLTQGGFEAGFTVML
jgi:hypothetical protein